MTERYKARVKSIIEARDTLDGRLFDYFIQALIILSLISFSFETLPDLSDEARYWLRIEEIAIVAIFTIEYMLRIAVAENKLKFIFSWWGIIDLLAILPFYISTGLDLRSVRALRLLRVFRILKLARYNDAMRRYHLAFSMAREELVLFVAVTAILLFLTAVGIYYFENEAQPELYSSVFSSLWWSVVSLTTVGYGDMYPITAGGRVFTGIVLLIGLGIVSIPAGLMASALAKAREIQSSEK